MLGDVIGMYLDNTLIYSKSIASHCKALHTVF